MNWKTFGKNTIKFFIIALVVITPFLVFAKLAPDCGLNRPCNQSDLTSMIGKIINFMIYAIAIPATVVMALWGGFKAMTSGGDPKKHQEGIKTLTQAAIGLAISLLAWLIVDTVIKILTGGNVS